MIGDQADVLPAQRSELQRFENVETGLHARGVGGMLCSCVNGNTENCSKQNEKRYARGAQYFPMESMHSNHPGSAGCNDILEIGARGRVVRVMCVWYTQKKRASAGREILF